MTPEQIEEAAIEAAAETIDEQTGLGPAVSSSIAKRTIEAYNAAMWRPIEEAPPHTPILTNCKHGLIEGEYQPEPDGTVEAYYWRYMSWYATHFRPLPKPPEKL